MEAAQARLKSLREKVNIAASQFKLAVDSLPNIVHDVQDPILLKHDNVKIVEADTTPFSFELVAEKQQVVVVLKGNWQMYHGEVKRDLQVTDVIKIPMGSPFKTTLTSDEPGAKFVYVQFK